MNAVIVPRNQITQELLQQMYAVFAKHYEMISLSRFQQDLDSKQFVLLVLKENIVKGFSTIELQHAELNGKPFTVLFSGDTVVDKDSWGQQTLAFMWIQFAGAVKNYFIDQPLYWFLIVKGHRTYRYLNVFGKEYYPHPSEQTSPLLKQRLLQLAAQRFPNNFNPLTGIIEFTHSLGQLRSEFSVIPEKDRNKPEVQYFLKMNPNYIEGHELACLCLLEEDNLKAIAKREFCKGFDNPEFKNLLTQLEREDEVETI